MIRLKFILLFVVVSMSAAAEGERCRVIKYEKHKFVRIKSRLHHGTHIELPESLIAKPVTGNQDLWDVEGGDKHIFVKPNEPGTKEGGSTTVTAVSQGNNAYHFLVERSDGDFDLCVLVTNDGGFLPENAFAGFARRSDEQAAFYQQQVAALQTRLGENEQVASQKVTAAIDEYRTQLFTGYSWKGGRAPYGKNLVTDVYDDGRFTYVRVQHNLGGVMSLFAGDNGREQFIDYKYDEAKRIYVVTGIYDKIYMKSDEKTRITIIRRGDPQTRRDL